MKILTQEEIIAALGVVKTEAGYKCQGFEGPCERTDGAIYRQRTSYVDEIRNWVCLCPDCAKGNNEYWADMWADCYHNCM